MVDYLNNLDRTDQGILRTGGEQRAIIDQMLQISRVEAWLQFQQAGKLDLV